MEMVVKTFFGLEDVLSKEIKNLGGKKIEVGNRIVRFEGDKRLMYECNLWLRTAISVLIPIRTFRFRDKEDFMNQIRKIEYKNYLRLNQTFAVKGAVNSQLFSHSQYPMLLLKDAIADYFREREGRRPNVDVSRPQILFDLYISEGSCTISLNSSGAPLFQRGYRKETGDAPINEASAAGLIYLSGWDQKSNFMDVFCGSGTIVIEAALMANGIPPNIMRKSYSFQNWADYDMQMWEDIYEKAPKRPRRDLNFKIVGSDTDGEVIKKARHNYKTMPLARTVEFEIKDFKDQDAIPGGGVLISNPPYGLRLEEENIEDMYKELGDFFKAKMAGYDCWVLSSNLEALKMIALKPSVKYQVYNGPLCCDFRKYTIFEGSLKEFKGENETKSVG